MDAPDRRNSSVPICMEKTLSGGRLDLGLRRIDGLIIARPESLDIVAFCYCELAEEL